MGSPLIQQKRSETDEAWAKFRLSHPELYSDEFKASPFWPYSAPTGRTV